MGLRILLRIGNECAAKTDLWNCLRKFLQSENEFEAKTDIGVVLEFFCEVRLNLRLRQNLELS